MANLSHQYFIDQVNAGLGPRQIASASLQYGGAAILIETEGRHRGLHLWLNDDDKHQAHTKDFCWSFIIAPHDTLAFNQRSKELQALPSEISIHASRVELLVKPQEEEDSLVSELLFLFDDRFLKEAQWYTP
jgi:hypothetical protein